MMAVRCGGVQGAAVLHSILSIQAKSQICRLPNASHHAEQGHACLVSSIGGCVMASQIPIGIAGTAGNTLHVCTACSPASWRHAEAVLALYDSCHQYLGIVLHCVDLMVRQCKVPYHQIVHACLVVLAHHLSLASSLFSVFIAPQ